MFKHVFIVGGTMPARKRVVAMKATGSIAEDIAKLTEYLRRHPECHYLTTK